MPGNIPASISIGFESDDFRVWGVTQMLETYTDYLQKLHESSPEDLGQRVALRLQFSAKQREIERCTDGVRDLILSMPRLSERIHSWLKEPAIPADDKRLVFDLTGYLQHPLDVVPHKQTLFAYLEDAYMTGYVFKRLLELVEAISQSASEEVKQWKDHLPVWLSQAKKVIPYEARKMERMVEEIIDTRLSTAFVPAVQKGVSTRERLQEAVNALKGDQTFGSPFSDQYAAA